MMLWFRPHPDSLLGQLKSPPYLRWEAIANLAWILALLIGPLVGKAALDSWLPPTLISIPLYIYLHGQVYAGPYRRLPWHASGIALLGLLLWPFNGVAIGYVISAAMCFAYLPTLRQWFAALAVLALPVAGMSRHLHISPWLMVLMAFVVVTSGFGHFVRLSNMRKDAQLRLSQDEVRRLATLAERERIGRDLHDLLGHTLSLVTLKSELARKLALIDPPRAQREMEEVERVARHALAEVRAAVTGMRRGDFAAELVSARLMLEASGLRFEGALPAAMSLQPAVEASLALVLREAITNIHRHANATQASATFTFQEDCFHMTIDDNGRGGLAAHGNGIGGMRERIRALGGTLHIESPARRGTTIRVVVPMAAHAASERPGDHAEPVAARSVA